MTAPKKPARGFASLSPAQRAEIAGIGGRTAHQLGRAHQFTPEEAREASLKGAAARKIKKIGRSVQAGFASIVVVMLLALAALIVFAVMFDAAACKARWSESGLSAKYSVMQGCLVQRNGGSWVPEGVLRDVNL
jgi:hypothetical protein